MIAAFPLFLHYFSATQKLGTHAGASVEEAVRTAKIIVQSTSVPGTYGFRLIRNGLEVFLWLMSRISREVKQAHLRIRLIGKRLAQRVHPTWGRRFLYRTRWP
jgi:hypothetical protein